MAVDMDDLINELNIADAKIDKLEEENKVYFNESIKLAEKCGKQAAEIAELKEEKNNG